MHAVDPSGLKLSAPSTGYSWILGDAARTFGGEVNATFGSPQSMEEDLNRHLAWVDYCASGDRAFDEAMAKRANAPVSLFSAGRLSIGNSPHNTSETNDADEKESGGDDTTKVHFTGVRLLDTDRSASFNFNLAVLRAANVTGPSVYGGDAFTIRVSFDLPPDSKECCGNEGGSKVRLDKENIFKFDNKRGDNGFTFYDNGRTGSVDITLRLRDLEGTGKRISIDVSGVYKNGDSYTGQGFVRIIGNKREKPR